MKHPSPFGLMALISILLTSFLFSAFSFAHAPELHKKEKAEKPQCDAASKVDWSTIKEDDLVMQAIKIKCADWIHDAPDNSKNSNYSTPKSSKKNH